MNPADDPERRVEEFHVTVEGSPRDWADLCEEVGVTPLFIQLPDGRLQLMNRMDEDPELEREVGGFIGDTKEVGVSRMSFLDFVRARGFIVRRVKHEVIELQDGETALYYEAHVKFDGGYRPDRKGASRDLFRPYPQRWYLTRRSASPIDLALFEESARLLGKHGVFAGIESEIVLTDTNPALDDGWLS